MNIQEAVTEALKNNNPDVPLNGEADYNNTLKDLGIDSIQFLGIVMSVCDQLGIDVSQINNMEISTENSVNEFVENFKPMLAATTEVPATVPA
jgi:acyl carrier protein